MRRTAVGLFVVLLTAGCRSFKGLDAFKALMT